MDALISKRLEKLIRAPGASGGGGGGSVAHVGGTDGKASTPQHKVTHASAAAGGGEGGGKEEGKKRKKRKREGDGEQGEVKRGDRGGDQGGAYEAEGVVEVDAGDVRLFRRVLSGTPCRLVSAGNLERRRMEQQLRAAADAARDGGSSARRALLPPRLAPPDPLGDEVARVVQVMGAEGERVGAELERERRRQRGAVEAAATVRLPVGGVVVVRERVWVPHDVRIAKLLGMAAG